MGFIENKLIEEFRQREAFSREELFDFYKKFEPDLKEGTLGWRIYNLKSKNILRSVQRGYYTLLNKTNYKPESTKDLLRLAKFISTKFESTQYCIWTTVWINEFSQHQSTKELIIIETEKEMVESMYYELKDAFQFNFFVNPDKRTIDYYLSEIDKAVVVKKMITRSPLNSRKDSKKDYFIPSLEKILVDLYSEKHLFYFYQGAELLSIYSSAIKHYSINYTTLFSYAKRRDKAAEIKQFLETNFKHLTIKF